MNYITVKFRIKDATSRKKLNAMALSVNFVWNACNEMSYKSICYNNKWLSGYELQGLTKGVSEDLGISSMSVQRICEEYATRRYNSRSNKLKWRSKKSLGWIPFKSPNIRIDSGSLVYYGHTFRFWQSMALPGKIRCGSFNQDAHGNWYINLTCEDLQYTYKKTGKSIGVDLGLKSTASYSDGTSFGNAQYYRTTQERLSKAQRANKNKQVKNIHRKIANQRKDALHKETTRLVKEYDLIIVGDVSPSKLKRTKMAKSVSDVSWAAYKTLLEYKAIRLGREFKVVNESWTTKTCHICNHIADFGGLKGLSVREWTCVNCNTHHDRDVNAAKNILLRFGHESLIKGAGNARDVNIEQNEPKTEIETPEL